MRALQIICCVLMLVGCGTRNIRSTPPSAPIFQKEPASAPSTVSVSVPVTPTVAVPVQSETVIANSSPDISGLVAKANQQLLDVFFGYDQISLGAEGFAILQQNAGIIRPILTASAEVEMIVEGHCDERGSAEYNLGLGDRRTRSIEGVLVELGLPMERFRRISYGKESPQCTDETEACWSRNRRVHFVLKLR